MIDKNNNKKMIFKENCDNLNFNSINNTSMSSKQFSGLCNKNDFFNDCEIETKKNQEKDIEIIFKSNSEINLQSCFHSNNDELLHRNESISTSMILPKLQRVLDLHISAENNRIKLAFGVIVRLILPVVNGIHELKKRIRVLKRIPTVNTINLKGSFRLLVNMLAYAVNTISLSLSSVQVVYKIHPIINAMKSRLVVENSKYMLNNNKKMINIERQDNKINIVEYKEKCVTCTVLAEPPPNTPIRADIIFIHGLHGSLRKTWKQGNRNNNDQQNVIFKRPPKRPKYSREESHSPNYYEKRARIDIIRDYENLFYNNQKLSCYYNQTNYNEIYEKELNHSISQLHINESTDCDLKLKQNFFKVNKIKTKNEKDKSISACWPGDWLPIDCPGVRVISLNYTTDPYLWRPMWIKKRNRTSLLERAREMQELLIEKNVGIGRPIIWVGHSKGGIFIKQIIVDAYERNDFTLSSLWRSSRGVFFYSVPHRGSSLADINLPFLRQSIELMEIQKNSTTILELHRRFLTLYHDGQLKIQVFSFIETALTLMSVLYLRIVGIDSADPGIGEVCGIHLDHREICKPRSRNCLLYTELTKMINQVS